MKIELSHIKQGLILEIEGEVDTLFEITDEDQRQINIIESNMKKLYTDTQKLF